MATIEIDGKEVIAEDGSMLIEATDKAGCYVPRFCYHKKLSVVANCRMCLVDIEKMPKPMPACATPVSDGMKVHTRSERALEAQRAVMEFLLVNHPLDCPICDQGGQCELQDFSLTFGSDASQYTEEKRSVADENLGSLISTEMTRCIHCTRCVRFCDEVAGQPELGMTGRGEHSKIGTYVEQALTSELSGNIIDLCPVGALTSKPFRFQARAWEMQQHASIAPHDCAGSNISLHTRRNEVMRVVPCENEKTNQMWLSDRDRFSYQGLSTDRLTQPMVRKDDRWQAVDWATAISVAADGLKKIIAHDGPTQIGALVSPSATGEEQFLTQRLFRALGSHNVDHRLRQTDFSSQNDVGVTLDAGLSMDTLSDHGAILLVGSDVQREQPMIGLRIREASQKNVPVMSVNPMDFDSYFEQPHKVIASPAQMVTSLAAIAKHLLALGAQSSDPAVNTLLKDVTVTEAEQNIAQKLWDGERPVIFMGSMAWSHPQAGTLHRLCALIATLSSGHCGALTDGANATGAWLAGAVPHRDSQGVVVEQPGLDTQAMFDNKLSGMLLLGVEPGLDCVNSQRALESLEQAECVVALATHQSDELRSYADVLLPLAAFSETAGSFASANGEWQHFEPAVSLPGEARPGWQILRVLAEALGVSFTHESCDDVRTLLNEQPTEETIAQTTWQCPDSVKAADADMTRIIAWPMYRVDMLVRHAEALQQSGAATSLAAHLAPALAEQLKVEAGHYVKVSQGAGEVQLPVVIDTRIPGRNIYIPAGYTETACLGAPWQAVTVTKAAEA